VNLDVIVYYNPTQPKFPNQLERYRGQTLKMRLSKLIFLMLASVITLVPLGRAQTPVRITFDDAVKLAVEHSHALKAAQTQIPQDQANEVTANLRPNPLLSWDAQFIPIFEPSQLTSTFLNDNAQYDLGIGYTFERGKKRQARFVAAKDQTAVTRYQVADAERMLTLNVAQQFINVLLAESNLEFAREALKSYQQTVDISRERFKTGDISEGDLLKVKLQLLQFQSDVSAADVARVQGLAQLRQFIGYDGLAEDYDVSGDLSYQPLPLNLDDLKLKALRQRPDLLEANANVTSAGSQNRLAIANGKQDLGTGFDYSHVSGTNTAAFFFNIPLPVFNRNQGEIARTRYAIDQAKQMDLAASDQVLTDVYSAYAAVRSNNEVLKLYTSGYLDQAKESLDISQYAFQHGAASLLDFLDSERSYRSVQLSYRQSLASYMLAVEQLKAAVGSRTLP
jgi:outer membrane protein, heavy metal efflux system